MTGNIQHEHNLSTTESLVLLCIKDEQNNVSYVVTIVSHPSGKSVTYRNSEIVSVDNIIKVFSSRALFGGQNSEKLRDRKNEVTIDSTDIKLA